MFKDEGYRLMGAAFEVYNGLGCGMAGEAFCGALKSNLISCDTFPGRASDEWLAVELTGRARRLTWMTNPSRRYYVTHSVASTASTAIA